jgi:hypothetical protein
MVAHGIAVRGRGSILVPDESAMRVSKVSKMIGQIDSVLEICGPFRAWR